MTRVGARLLLTDMGTGLALVWVMGEACAAYKGRKQSKSYSELLLGMGFSVDCTAELDCRERLLMSVHMISSLSSWRCVRCIDGQSLMSASRNPRVPAVRCSLFVSHIQPRASLSNSSSSLLLIDVESILVLEEARFIVSRQRWVGEVDVLHAEAHAVCTRPLKVVDETPS